MNQRGSVNVLLIIVIVMLLGAVGYFAIVKRPAPISQQQVPITAQADLPTGAPSPAPTNLFTNDIGGYSFDCPSEWEAAVSKYNSGDSLFGPNAGSSAGLGGVSIYENRSSIEDFFNGVDAQFTDKTDVLVDGVVGVKSRFKGFPSSGEMVVLLKDGNIYGIAINSENEQDLRAFERIVSTFKFTR